MYTHVVNIWQFLFLKKKINIHLQFIEAFLKLNRLGRVLRSVSSIIGYYESSLHRVLFLWCCEKQKLTGIQYTELCIRKWQQASGTQNKRGNINTVLHSTQQQVFCCCCCCTSATALCTCYIQHVVDTDSGWQCWLQPWRIFPGSVHHYYSSSPWKNTLLLFIFADACI